jgi:hypothetical protein
MGERLHQRHGRRRRWITGAALAAAGLAVGLATVGWPAAARAKPGTVTTLAGRPYSGDVTEDDRFYYIQTPGGQVTLDKRNVAGPVEYDVDVDAHYAQRHDKLAATDVKGRVDLSHWARDHGRPDLALSALEEARTIDPANRDVALAIDDVQRQAELDRRQGRSTPQARGRTPSPATAVAATSPAGPPPVEHRLLTDAEVNVIRQFEMRTDDRAIKVRLDHSVARRYELGAFGSATGQDAAAFGRQSGEEQALEILKFGSPDMAKDVRILTDPTPLHLFKTKVMPIVALGCASTACHGGTHAGDFHLFTGESTQALYTNFYILMTYTVHINGVQYLPMDREVPQRSLVLQFGLPPLMGRPPHPPVKDMRVRFRSVDDAAYMTIDDWLTDDLRVLQPQYGFNVSPRLLARDMPSTMPATMPAPAATRPAVHGAPLPRLGPNGPVTLPSTP